MDKADDTVDLAEQKLKEAEILEKAAQEKFIQAKANLATATATHPRKCQLRREEEITLYFQCTQNAINNYALDHYGDADRSYPHWKDEFKICMDSLNGLYDFEVDGETCPTRP